MLENYLNFVVIVMRDLMYNLMLMDNCLMMITKEQN
jgi:hypothetical protein